MAFSATYAVCSPGGSTGVGCGELPGWAVDRLDLNRQGMSGEIRSEEVVVWNVSRKWRREDAQPAKLGDHKVLPDLPS